MAVLLASIVVSGTLAWRLRVNALIVNVDDLTILQLPLSVKVVMLEGS